MQLECALGISNATTVSKSFKQSLDHFWGVAAATLAFTTLHLLEPRLMVIVAFIKLLEPPPRVLVLIIFMHLANSDDCIFYD